MTSIIDIGPFSDDVRAVAAHYGVAEKDVVPAPTQGEVNLTVFFGTDLTSSTATRASEWRQISRNS